MTDTSRLSPFLMSAIGQSYPGAPAIALNALANGAKGDGTTDDTTALQALLDTGKPVFLPTGTYKITASLTLKTSGQWIFGNGYSSKILYNGSTVGTAIKMLDTTQRTDITIRDLRITDSVGGGIAIDGNYFAICRFQNLRLDGGVLRGIRFANVYSDYNHVSDCVIVCTGGGTGNTGVECSNTGNENTLTRLRIMTDSNSTGVFIDSAACSLYDVDVETGALIGIRVGANARETTLYSPYLEANATNLKIESGAAATLVIGGTIESATTKNIDDAGTGTLLLMPRVQFAVNPLQINMGTASADGLMLDMAQPTGASVLRDSHSVLLRGTYTDGSSVGHNIDWRILNNITSVAGSKLRFMSRSDAASYSEKFSVDGSGTGILSGRLQLGGPLQRPIASKTAAYTIVNSTDGFILGDATSAAFQVTLPTAVNIQGRQFTIKRIQSGANNVTVGTTSSQTIDGAATKTLGAQWSWITVVSDGSNWQIVGQGGTVT